MPTISWEDALADYRYAIHVEKFRDTLSTRAFNALRNDCEFLADVAQLSEGDLLRIPNFGPRSRDKVKELLVNHGLTLGTQIVGRPDNDTYRTLLTERSADATRQMKNAELPKEDSEIDVIAAYVSALAKKGITDAFKEAGELIAGASRYVENETFRNELRQLIAKYDNAPGSMS